jgi:hypothetical protein
MSDLLNLAAVAHGGLGRWHSHRTVSAELSVGGLLLDLKGQTGLLADAIYEVDIHEQRATLGRLARPIARSASRPTGWFSKPTPER